MSLHKVLIVDDEERYNIRRWMQQLEGVCEVLPALTQDAGRLLFSNNKTAYFFIRHKFSAILHSNIRLHR